MEALLIIVAIPFLVMFLQYWIKNPILGLVLVLIITPFEPFLPEIGQLTFGRILGALAVVVWMLHLGKNLPAVLLNKSSLNNRIYLFLFAGFLGSVYWLGYVDGIDPIITIITFALLGIFAIMVHDLVKTEKELKFIFIAMMIAGVASCIPAFLYAFGVDIYTPLGAEAPITDTEETLRASNIGGNPNSLGIRARNGVFGCLILFTIFRRKIDTLFLLSMMFILFTGLALSGSRTNFYGALIHVGLAGFFMFPTIIKGRSILLLGVAVLLALGFLGFTYVPDPIKNRLLLGGDDERIASRAEHRLNFTEEQQDQAMDFLYEHPVFGVGLKRTDSNVSTAYGAHDTFSVIVGEMGLLGIITFLSILFWAMKSSVIAFLISKDWTYKLRMVFLFTMLLTMLIMGYKGGYVILYDRSFWIVLGLISRFT